jgi:hypothetical protein
MLKNKNETRLYTQVVCQSKYSKLPYKNVTLQKFGLNSSNIAPVFKSVSWYTSINAKKVSSAEQLFSHFLLMWFNKQSHVATWYNPSKSWLTTTTNHYFYLLRYKFFNYIGVHPFVPIEKWASLNPRKTALFAWESTFITEDLPLPLEDYLTLEGPKYRLAYEIRLNLNKLLPGWYSKVFALRAHHYPVV